MAYAIEITKGAASSHVAPLSAPEALQRLEAAEVCGIAVTCSDTEGRTIPKADQQKAARGEKR